MKAITIILAAVFSLQFSFLFAGNNEARPVLISEAVSLSIATLAPVTPVEATFEEANETNAFNFDFLTLAPETPAEADFSDVVPEKNPDLTILAPVTPAEADFNENTEDQAVNLKDLAPVTPSGADFE